VADLAHSAGPGSNRGRSVSASARVPHGALHLLPLPFDRLELPRLRAGPCEPAPRGTSRRLRTRAPRAGRRGMSKHVFGAEAQQAARAPGDLAGGWHPPFSPEFAHESATQTAASPGLRGRTDGPLVATRTRTAAPARLTRRRNRRQSIRAAGLPDSYRRRYRARSCARPFHMPPAPRQ